MMQRITAGVVFLAMAAPAFGQQDNWRLVRAKTEARLKQIAGGVRGAMGMAALDLTSGERFGINENLIFPQGSAIKIGLLMEVFKQASEAKFKLTDLRVVDKQHKVGGSGVLQELGDASSHLSIRDLCILMIVLSDNTATNILIDLVGMDRVNATLAALGLTHTRLQRRMMDPAASARGEENISTPAEAVRVMEILYKGEFLSREACADILSILKKPKPGAIVSGVPENVAVAFKPGSIAGVSTEWAIVYLKDRPYAVAVMENYEMDGEGPAAMKEISLTLYDYFWRLSRATGHGLYKQ